MSTTGTRQVTQVIVTIAWTAIGLVFFSPSGALAQNRVGILGTGSCGFPNIVSVIAVARPGATILLEEDYTFDEVLGTIDKDLTIRAGRPGCTDVSNANAPNARIDGRLYFDRIATIDADVTLRQITVLNGQVSSVGGAGLLVTSRGDLTLHDALVSVNKAADYSAGIHVQSGGYASLEGSSLVFGNISRFYCGGIEVEETATVVLQDETKVLGNVGNGVCASGTLQMRDDAQVWGNIGYGISSVGGTVELHDRVIVGMNTEAGVFVNGRGSALLAPVGSSDSPVIKDNSGRGIDASSGATVNLNGVKIEGNAGGIYAASGTPHITLNNVNVHDNHAEYGGGIEIRSGHLELLNSDVSENTAIYYGGGLYHDDSDGNVVVSGSSFRNNSAEERGGGIAVRLGADLDLVDTTIVENNAVIEGGGIYVSDEFSELSATAGALGSAVVENNSAARGGGLFADGASVSLFDQIFRSNSAETDGGAINQAGEASITFHLGQAENNTAGARGGAFAVDGGTLWLRGADLLSNSAVTGAAMAIADGVVTAENVWFHENLANAADSRGGAIALLADEAATLPQLVLSSPRTAEGCQGREVIGPNEYCSELRSNQSKGQGGAIYMEGGIATIESAAFIGNTTAGVGQAILLEQHPTSIPSMEMVNVLLVDNGDTVDSDVVRVVSGTLVGQYVTSADNLGTPFWFGPGSAGSMLGRSIVWDQADLVIDPATSLPAACTMFRAVTGTTTGANRIFGQDPGFVATTRGDYRLDASRSVHAVDQCRSGLSWDLDGFARPVTVAHPRTPFDRGAFEAQP